jgi:hypothetical protein
MRLHQAFLQNFLNIYNFIIIFLCLFKYVNLIMLISSVAVLFTYEYSIT